MMLDRYQLPVYSPISAATIAAGVQGAMFDDAPARAQLTRKVCAEYASTRAIFVDSGTSALSLALVAAAGQRNQLPVALPAYGCWDLASAAIAARVPVILYDLDPRTLAPDVASLEQALAHGVSSVVLVHHYGIPINTTEIVSLTQRAGALLIEDAAQAFGARTGAARTGASGDYTVLSFGRGKGLSGGGGGALLARGEAACELDTALPQPARGMRELGVMVAQWVLGRPSLYSLPAAVPALRLGETVYHQPHAPRAASSASIRAVSAGWRAAEIEAKLRAERAAWLIECCSPAFAQVEVAPNTTPSYLRLPLIAQSRVLRDGHLHTARRLGIIRGYPLALPDLPQLQPALRGASTQRYNGARELAARLLTVPVHARLTRRDLASIAKWMHRVARGTSTLPSHSQSFSAAASD